MCTEKAGSPRSHLYLLEEVPENRHRLFAIFLIHNMLQVLQRNLLSAAPNLRAMNHTFLGQVRQEGSWVPIYDFGHGIGADALILTDKSINSWQGFVKTLDEENDTEFLNRDCCTQLAHLVTTLWLTSLSCLSPCWFLL